MANPIVQQINAELTALQKELGQFKETVDYLNNAKNSVKDAVIKVNHSEAHFNSKVEELKKTYNSFIKLTDSVSDVISKIDTVNFPDRLDSIEKTVKETISFLNDTRKATLDELQKASEIITKVDFDGKFKALDNLVSNSVQSSDTLTQYISKLKIGEKIEKLEKKFENDLSVNFQKTEKNTNKIAVDTASAIHNLNLPTRLDKLDANVAGIMAAIQSTQSRLDNVERNLSDKMRDLSDKQKEEMQSMKSFLDASAKKQQTTTYITWALVFIGIVAIIIVCKK